jgi:hypothetical protein
MTTVSVTSSCEQCGRLVRSRTFTAGDNSLTVDEMQKHYAAFVGSPNEEASQAKGRVDARSNTHSHAHSHEHEEL